MEFFQRTGAHLARSTRPYQNAKNSLILLFSFYVIVAVAGASRGGEYFPVFSWSLFTEVRNPTAWLEVEVLQIGDDTFPEPVNYFALGNKFPGAKRRDVGLIKGLNHYWNTKEGTPEAAEQFLTTIERRFLAIDQPVRYQIVGVSFDPLVRYRTGDVQARVVFLERHVGATQ